MSWPRTLHITSVAQLRAAAADWDDLWHRSGVTLPTLRAELVAQWVEQFAARAGFHALAVEDGGRWVAALPLVGRRVGRLIDAGAMPSNEWSSSGDLLLDPAAGADTVLDVLVGGLAGLGWPLFWLEEVSGDSPRWGALAGAAARGGMAVHFQRQLEVGRIEIDHDWVGYKKGWSRRHRQQMARHARRLGRRDHVQLNLLSQLGPEEVEGWMRRGFEVEDRSWKGAAGTSVLKTPEMLTFFTRQAEQLARWGQLELAFLECGGAPIAFAYGMSGKGVYHSYKVGYDAEYAGYSPGQLLRYFLFRRFYGDRRRRAIDSITSSDAHRKWRPTMSAVGRLIIASRRPLARAALQTYKHCWPCVRRLRAMASR